MTLKYRSNDTLVVAFEDCSGLESPGGEWHVFPFSSFQTATMLCAIVWARWSFLPLFSFAEHGVRFVRDLVCQEVVEVGFHMFFSQFARANSNPA